MKSDPTKSGLQTAAGDAKSATETLASDLKGLGKPDTPAGQQAQDSLDQLSTSLQQNVTTIENAVKGASGVSGVLTAVPTVTATFATMGTEVKTTFTDLQGLDAKGELKTAFTNSSACNTLTGGRFDERHRCASYVACRGERRRRAGCEEDVRQRSCREPPTRTRKRRCISRNTTSPRPRERAGDAPE